MQKILDGEKLDFCDVLIRPKRSQAGSRKDIQLERDFRFPHSPKNLRCVPIFAANMDTTGSLAMGFALEEMQVLTCLHKFYKVDELISKGIHKDEYIWLSTGASPTDMDRIREYKHKTQGFAPNICIDIANGYTEFFVNRCKEIRDLFPFSIIMAGNVCTPEMVEELIIHGKVDIVKVGIGPGSVCTTRKMTGVGYPQLSAVMECADAAHGLRGHICSDGGCTEPGDVAKAIGGGADFVMLGGMLAGCDECEGSWEYLDTKETEYFYEVFSEKDVQIKKHMENIEGIFDMWVSHDTDNRLCKARYIKPKYSKKKALAFHGMSSREAMVQHYGGVADYRAPEGKEVSIPYKGFAKDVIKDILGGLRGACSSIGAMNIKDMNKCTTFVRIIRR